MIAAPPAPLGDIHIAGCVAYAKPEAVAGLVRSINAISLAEVPRHDERGRLVVLIEGRSSGQVFDVIEAIRALDGVIAVHLAYQHAEPEADLQELQ